MSTKQKIFRPSAWETKAAGTHAASKLIIDAETAARDAKTRRLRNSRLEREAAEPKPVATVKRRRAPRPERVKS